MSTIPCSECPYETPVYIDLVKHYRAVHGMSLNADIAAANRRHAVKTLPDAVADHDLLYGIETR